MRIDVHAVKQSSPIPIHILCECKHWNKPVKQNVIHSFRSICSDIGAHYGLIISKKGFQCGANESREHTNIHLLSFTEFQAAFFQEWRQGIFMEFVKMDNSLLPIFPGNPNFIDDTALQEKLRPVRLFEKYEIFFGARLYTSYFIERGEFPIVIMDPRGNPTSLKEITVRSPRQYFEIAKQACADALSYFDIQKST